MHPGSPEACTTPLEHLRVDGLGMLLIEHGPSPSFPSRHMAVACAFALGLVFQYGFRKTWPALVLAGLGALAAITLGVWVVA